MKLNLKRKRPALRTHEGAAAVHLTPETQLRRAVLSCLLWEDAFYESGVSIAQRIEQLVPRVEPAAVAALASEARHAMKLRHAPLWLAKAMVESDRHRPLVADVLADVVDRADEPAEFLAMYWADGKRPLANQVKRGLARSLAKFDGYQLAKHDRPGDVRLRDVLFLTHAKPRDAEQAEAFRAIADGKRPAVETWESKLSAATPGAASGDKKSDAQKRKDWTDLLQRRKLGAMALLRNLRNMEQAGVQQGLVRRALNEMQPGRVLPMRFVSAARHAPRYEPELERQLFRCVSGKPKLPGRTALLVDVSYSMVGVPVSRTSELTRLDAAAALAMIAREMAEDVVVYTFSNDVKLLPARRGFALRDLIVKGPHGGTNLGAAVRAVDRRERFDRLIVLTDEQSHDRVDAPSRAEAKGRAYMLNVATYENAVGFGPWVRIDGWSEATLEYIRELECA